MKTVCDWNKVSPSNGDGVFTGTSGSESRTPSPYSAPCNKDKVSHPPLKYECTIRGRNLKYCSKCMRHMNSPKKGQLNTTHYSDEHTGKPAEDKYYDTSPPVANFAQDFASLPSIDVVFFDNALRDSSDATSFMVYDDSSFGYSFWLFRHFVTTSL